MKLIISWLLNIMLLTILICISTLLVKGWLEMDNYRYVPGIGRYKLISIYTDSMKPVMQAGDVILVDSRHEGGLSEGDIVTYWRSGDGSLLTHRIVGIEKQNEKKLYTRGDANNVMDGTPLTEKDIVGRFLMTIPHGGAFISYLHTKSGFMLLIMLPILIALGLEARRFYPGEWKITQLTRKQTAEVKQTEA